MYKTTTIDMKKTGERIQSLREQKALSVKELMNLLGPVSERAIYKWQSGESLPDIEHLVTLARIFQRPVEEILVFEEAAEDEKG